MKRLYNNICKYFMPIHNINRYNTEETILLIPFIFLNISLLLSSLVYEYYFMKIVIIEKPARIFIPIYLAILFFNKVFGKARISANIYILMTQIFLITTAINTGGIHSPVLFWLPLTIIIPFILLGKNETAYWALSCIIIVFLFYVTRTFYRHDIEVVPTVLINQFRYNILLIQIFTLGFTLYIFHSKKSTQFEDLKNEYRESSSLLQILAHDIINPLNLILGHVDFIEGEGKGSIKRASNHILDIITHVKEMQALDSGKQKIKLRSVAPNEIINDIQFIFEDRLKEKELTLTIENNLSPEVEISAEPISLTHQVLNNIISNAIKFSNKKSEIKLILLEEKNIVNIIVQDEGIGIPENILVNLFDFEKTTSRKGTEGERGTGFGLPLARKYIELYGGKIVINSIEKTEQLDIHGTSITIILNKF